MKLTLADAKPTISKVLSMASTDSRVVDYINEAQERLIYKGKWASTYARYKVSTDDGTITWPRQLETIESLIVDEIPGVVRNDWFEFLESGPGLIDSTSSVGRQLIDRAEAVTFSDLTGSDKRLRVYSSVSADVGKKLLFQGYDESGEWIRTQVDGVYVDGEYITLTSGYVDSVNLFSSVVGVQKPITEGNVKVHEYDTTKSTQRSIAEYEPLETSPTYRRSIIPGITKATDVVVVGKLRYLPAKNDIDWLFINNLPALKMMVTAIRKEENNIIDEATFAEAKAIQMLNEQLMHHLGDGAVAVPKMASPNVWGGGINNLI